MINSAGINFGKPNEEFIIESDGNGAITSARNAVTGTEYINENYSEIITGTLASPFGDYTRTEIYELLKAHSISMECVADASALNMGTIPLPFFSTLPISGTVTADIYAELLSGGSGDWAIVNWYKYNDETENQDFVAFQNGSSVTLTAHMASIPTVVTIYHHPMPE